jgi:DNA-directed RNA polymerase subunit H (RpoH/RPB5)
MKFFLRKLTENGDSFSRSIPPNMNEEEIERLWKSREVILSTPILKDNYCIEESDHMTLDEFRDWAEEEGFYDKMREMTFSCQSKDDGDGHIKRIKVYWPAEAKLGSGEYCSISQNMELENLKNAIIIVRDSVTPHAQATLRLLNSQKIYITVFNMNELQFDIFEHEKVPTHTICSSKKKKLVMQRYNVTHSQIPKIKVFDPVIKRLGATKGQLIEILEESDTMPGYFIPMYRTVS